MGLGRLLVASDGSPHSDHALGIGKLLAARAGASFAVVQVGGPGSRRDPEPARITCPVDPASQRFLRDGVPGVEIARCAEQWRADLVVLGRNPRPAPGLGRTTDMILRRRHGPTLLVPRNVTGFQRILYALDGSERGLRILDRGGHFAAITGATPMAVCVLPPDSVQSAAGGGWPHPRLTRVEEAMERRPDLGGRGSLAIRWGEPVAEVLRHLVETAAELLVLGLRQGGPGGDPGSGHIARDLLRAVPVAILTVPI
jgi:nucleotide-binding universal stress UspA family protein